MGVRPDGKTQVTCEYKLVDGVPVPQRVHTVVISTQHSEDVTNEKIAADLMEHVIKPVVPANYLDDKTIYHLNPSGRFVIGGPHGDAGLTGRKIIIDTYGGWGAHGGGAFSGKDTTKVDRSAAYAARWVAKSLVASGLCSVSSFRSLTLSVLLSPCLSTSTPTALPSARLIASFLTLSTRTSISALDASFASLISSSPSTPTLLATLTSAAPRRVSPGRTSRPLISK